MKQCACHLNDSVNYGQMCANTVKLLFTANVMLLYVSGMYSSQIFNQICPPMITFHPD